MTPLQQFSDDLRRLVARCAPAVVGIAHRGGQGTGFGLTPDGFLLTNRHVVGGATRVRVSAAGRDLAEGEVVGGDAATDLAVVRIDVGDLPVLSLSGDDDPAVGQVAVAIGNPYRFEGSVSLGVVSALDRTLPLGDGRAIEGLVQTDAAVNPGNSGGPLLDAWGNVIGVTTAIVAGAQGIGFAVPAATARWVAGLLIQRGEIRRPRLGIAGRSEILTAPLRDATGRERAVRVLGVEGGSPADAAGLREGDLVIGVDGHALRGVDDLQRHLVLAGEGERTLELWRGGARRQLRVAPRAPSSAPPAPPVAAARARRRARGPDLLN